MHRMAKRSWRGIVPGRGPGPAVAVAVCLAGLSAAAGCGEASEPAPPAAESAAAVERREDALLAIDRLLEARRIDEAARVASRLAEVHPDDASVALRLGRVLLAERTIVEGAIGEGVASGAPRFSGAADALLRAIDGGIEDRETLVLAATLLEASDRPTAAEPLWRRLADRDSDDAEAALRLALNLDSTGRRHDAIEIAERVHARVPDDPFAGVVLGELRLAGGDERGLDLIAEAVRLDPGNAAWRLRRAVWLRRLGRCEEAITLLSALEANDAARLAATREIATCWMLLGRPAKAADAWETLAIEGAPRSPWLGEAWREAAWRRLDAGDRESAQRCLRRAAIEDPADPSIADLQAAFETSPDDSALDPR